MNKGFISLGLAAMIAVIAVVAGGGSYGAYKYAQVVTESNELKEELKQKTELVIPELKAEEDSTDTIITQINNQSSTTASTTELSEKNEIKEETNDLQTSKSAATIQLKEESRIADLCLNIDGIQAIIPNGYTSESGICTLIQSDKCLNIDGLQASVPSGYSEESKVCTKIQFKDVCFNLEGIQSEVPDGLINTKELGCVTEYQYEKAIAEDVEKKKEEEKVESCSDLADEVKRLSYEIMDIEAEYDAKIQDIYSKGGGLVGGANAEVSNLRREEDSVITPLENESDKLNLQYVYECN